MAKAMPDPATAAAKWAQNLGAAGQAYTAGVQAVTQDPGVAAAAASDRYVAGVQANVNKFRTNVVTGLANWQQAAVNKGAPRLATGAQAASDKVATVFGQLFPYIAQVRGSLPQRGDLEANIARSA